MIAPPTFPSPVAVSLRVRDVRRAAAFYQQIGFTYVMAVPDENEEWLLCLLRYGNASILLGAVDHPHFPRSRHERRLQTGSRVRGGRIDLAVADLVATYAACMAAGCQIIVDLIRELSGAGTFSCLDPFGYEWRFTQVISHTSFPQFPHPAKLALS